tara:strand:+ start:1935 stop:2177 length:243 start_codon:yes stop_codon:yes gene_type:complete
MSDKGTVNDLNREIYKLKQENFFYKKTCLLWQCACLQKELRPPKRPTPDAKNKLRADLDDCLEKLKKIDQEEADAKKGST